MLLYKNIIIKSSKTMVTKQLVFSMWQDSIVRFKWLAHKVANFGDHYQFIATKSVLRRAISKEILTKRGLISISDYYRKVAHI